MFLVGINKKHLTSILDINQYKSSLETIKAKEASITEEVENYLYNGKVKLLRVRY